MAARLTLAPVTLTRRAGSTGMMSPNPIVSRRSVAATKTIAWRPGGRGIGLRLLEHRHVEIGVHPELFGRHAERRALPPRRGLEEAELAGCGRHLDGHVEPGHHALPPVPERVLRDPVVEDRDLRGAQVLIEHLAQVDAGPGADELLHLAAGHRLMPEGGVQAAQDPPPALVVDLSKV